jgi:hypothetical protein
LAHPTEARRDSATSADSPDPSADAGRRPVPVVVGLARRRLAESARAFRTSLADRFRRDRRATVRARTPLRLYALDRRHFLTAVSDHETSGQEADSLALERVGTFDARGAPSE